MKLIWCSKCKKYLANWELIHDKTRKTRPLCKKCGGAIKIEEI